MIEDHTILVLDPEVTFESLSDGRQTVILHLASGQIYTCNITTTAFLRALDGKRTFREVLDQLHTRFEVAREKLKADLGDMGERLLSEGLLRKQAPPEAGRNAAPGKAPSA